MEKELICPNCGDDNIIGKMCLDTDELDGVITRKMYGYCERCKTSMYWKEKYGFICYESAWTY